MAKEFFSWCFCRTPKNNNVCDENSVDDLTGSAEMIDFPETQKEGTTRNKVALLPGFSLMDWIRLGNSGKDLTGVRGEFLDVTEEELQAHSAEDDAWISIRGKVYNVTSYMGFHPGGIPELMRGVGKDATKLFTEIHPWVNYESILQKCVVGRLVRRIPSSLASLERPVSQNAEVTEVSDFDAGCVDESVFDSFIKMNWCQTSKSLKMTFHCKVSSPQVVVQLKGEAHVRVLIRIKKKLHVFGFELERKVHWPCSVSMNTDTGKLELSFEKIREGYWKSYGSDDPDNAMIVASVDEMEAYHSVEIVSITEVTHNVRMFVFRFLEKVLMWVPIGHDIRIRGVIEGIDYAKQYTPTPPYLPHGEPTLEHWHSNYICCMVKYYEEGALTPYLFSKEEHDIVEIGGMSGSFNIRKLSRVTELYLIAAGSGLTPMLRLIVWAVAKKEQVKAMNLLYVNRHEEDIIWRKELNELSKAEKWFTVTYCLSRPPDNWKGLKGRLTSKMLNGFLPVGEVHPEEFPDFFICACGPIPFTEMIQKYLIERGYDSWSHCFI